MKIGIDISQIIYDTGVSNYTKELVKNLAKIDKRDSFVLFASTARQGSKITSFISEIGNSQKVTLKKYKFPNTVLEIIHNRIRLIPMEKFIGNVDIFHSSDWTQPKFSSSNTKKVTTVHDMVAYLFPQSLTKKIVSTQKRGLNLAKKECDIFIADSQSTKNDLEKFLEIPSEKIKVIPLAASSIYKPQDEDKVNEVLKKYKIKKPYILSVATQEPRKNIRMLVDSYQKLLPEYPNVNLVLTGKKAWGEAINQEMGYAEGKIIQTGFIQQEDLPFLYAGCRVFVYPSLYEGFGLPILEAMASGAPVITSGTSSMKEIAKDVAILIDPRSEPQLTKAIKMVLSLNLEDYQKMVKASMERAKKYSWAKTAKETLKVYRELAGST